jgi:hypothetical protein
MQLKRKLATSTLSVAALGGAALMMVPPAATAASPARSATTSAASAAATSTSNQGYVARAVAHLDPLNNSGVSGFGVVRLKVSNNRIDVVVRASGLLANMPHAMHIHWGRTAAHECPTVKQDANRDHRLNVAEGVPSYGPIRVSLTTRGDTSPNSALAVDRFSTAPHGKLVYKRYSIKIDARTARAIRAGQAVLVLHGLDYNQNGKYDFAGAGASELNSAVPAEATDPAACGVLHRH